MQLLEWDKNLLDSIENSFNSRLSAWLTHHPIVNWLINHPLLSFIAIILVIILMIRLFLTIYRLIAHTIDRIWLGILRSPWLLLKLLFGWEFKPKQNLTNTTITNYEVSQNPQQLQDILERLDEIQQQQQQIIQDIASLKQRSLNPIDLNPSLATKELPPTVD